MPLAEAAVRLGYADTDWRAAARLFPVRWPAQYLALAESPEGAPIRRMGVPDPAETAADPGDLADPVGERRLRDLPFVVRKHADRAILIVTSRCHFYCRFCFRRSFPEGDHRDPGREDIARALAGLAGDPALEEIILSGGDPLVLDDERLLDILDAIRATTRVRRVRVHTRAPVHHPARVTDALAGILAGGLPLRVVTHFNHPVELTEASRGAVRRLQSRGIPVLDQTVLLRGVNDDAAILADLLVGLAQADVRPHYIHHPDRAPGNAAFRLTFARGLEIVRDLRSRVPDDIVPPYVVDLPDGSGKVPVESLERLSVSRYRCPVSGLVFDDVPEWPAPGAAP